MRVVREIIVAAWWSFVGGIALLSLGVLMIVTGSTVEHATSTAISVVAVVIGIIALGIAIEQGRAAKRSDEQQAQLIERMNTIVGLLRNIRDRG